MFLVQDLKSFIFSNKAQKLCEESSFSVFSISVQNLVLCEIILFKHNIDSILLSVFAPKQCFLRTSCVVGLLLVLTSLIVCFTTVVMTAKGSPS